jgi:redox-regulated HSP33 family molecular chaperone
MICMTTTSRNQSIATIPKETWPLATQTLEICKRLLNRNNQQLIQRTKALTSRCSCSKNELISSVQRHEKKGSLAHPNNGILIQGFDERQEAPAHAEWIRHEKT